MKYVRALIFLLSFLTLPPALAQWQTSNHSVPIGRGAGATGFGSAAPGTAGLPLVSNGAGVDPSFRPLPASSMAVDVFLIGGQSNAVGQGTVAGTPTVPAGQVLQVNGSTIADANDPVGAGVHQATSWSAWPAFGLSYYRATGRIVAFVQMAVDGTTQTAAADVSNGNWDASGTLYGAAVAALDASLPTLSAAGYVSTFRGVLWMQGETDAAQINASVITGTNYENALKAMLVRFRSHYGATMPFYVFRTGTDTAASDTGFAAVRAAQEDVAATDPYTTIVYRGAIDFTTAGWQRTDSTVHWQTSGLNNAGTGGATAVVAAQRGAWLTNGASLWTPWWVGIGTAAPRAPFDVLISGTPNTSGDGVPGGVITGPGADPSLTGTGMISLQSNDPAAINKGGCLASGGRTTAALTVAANFSAACGYKENANDGDYAGAWAVYTRLNGGAFVKKLNVSSAGAVSFTSYSKGLMRTDTSGNITALAGTTGGVVYFDGSNIPQGSGVLAASQLVVGGGAGNQPGTIGSTGTATTVLHGAAGANPSFSAVNLGTDVTGNLPNSNLVNAALTVNGQTCTLGSSCTVAPYMAEPPHERITLTSGAPVMTGNVPGATSVFVTPYKGNTIPTFDGTNMNPTPFAEVSQATTDATKSPAAVAASKVYDIFCWVDAGTNRCTRGPAWTNDTTRGYTLTLTLGIYLNTSSVTNGPAALRGTWVGAIRSNGSSTIDWNLGGADTAASLYVYNYYNQKTFKPVVSTATASWTYATATVRQVNANANYQINFLAGASEDFYDATYRDLMSGTSAVNCLVGVALDATNTFSGSSGGITGIAANNRGDFSWQPVLGVHFLAATEYASAATCTFNGGNNGFLNGTFTQ